MAGRLLGDTVLIEDKCEASQIYNKGFYGYTRKGGALELDLLEAIYLQEADRLHVEENGRSLSLEDLIRHAVKHRAGFETRYLVYRDLRSRGYVVKLDGGEFHFRIFPRGGTPTNTQTKAWVLSASERSEFHIDVMLEQACVSERTRKELMLAVVDEEGDITYYETERAEPKGSATGESPVQVEGLLLEDTVLVLQGDQADQLVKCGHYGKKIGRQLQLSFIEAAYLMEKGWMQLRSGESGRSIALVTLLKKAKSLQPDFQLRLRAFKDMRSRGLVVKTGFKYGTHFRVYEGDPAKHHSKYLVHAVPSDYVTIWAEISRAIRLGHGVKKEVLFCSVTKDQVNYVRLKRIRP